jgi:hypothetical protein
MNCPVFRSPVNWNGTEKMMEHVEHKEKYLIRQFLDPTSYTEGLQINIYIKGTENVFLFHTPYQNSLPQYVLFRTM